MCGHKVDDSGYGGWLWLGLGHRRGRELFGATRDCSGGDHFLSASSGCGTGRDRWDAGSDWAVYGSVRSCIRGHSEFSSCRAADGTVAIGCHLVLREAANWSCNVHAGWDKEQRV